VLLNEQERFRSERSSLYVLFSVVVVDLVGFGIVMPVLPFWAKQLGADATTLGLVLSSYAAAQFLFAPMWGRLSDRFGRRPVMLTTIAGTAASLLLLGLAGSIATILAARVLAGVFAANVGVASAYVTDVTDERERTRWMGMIGASFAVGFLLGPAIGGLLAPLGYAVPMLAAAALAGANFLVALVRLREPARAANAAPAARPRRFAALANPTVRLLCFAYLLFSLAVTQLESMFAFFMADRFQWDAREVAWILVGMAIVMGGVQGGGLKALSARFKERQLVIGGALLLVAGFALVPLAPTVALLLAPLALSAIGRGVSQPALMSLASQEASAETRGAVLGTFQASASLARVFGPTVAGALYDRTVGAPFFLASVLVLAVALLAPRLPEGAGGVVPAIPEP
jgi:DHA1 family tetracycline resistance protein-like MFS transporter